MRKSPTATIVVDLGFGDAGKGTVVDFLTRKMVEAGEKPSIIRFSGGSQCGHNVVTSASSEGGAKHHLFSQFGSGSLVKGVKTHYSRHALLDPIALKKEGKHLIDLGCPWGPELFTADPDVPIITDIHGAANRIKEILRGHSIHGSCGRGVGETAYIAENYPTLGITLKDLFCGGTEFLTLRLIHIMEFYRSMFDREDIERLCKGTTAFDARLFIDEGKDGDGTYRAKRCAKMAEELLEAAKSIKMSDDRHTLKQLSEKGPLVFEGSQGLLIDRHRGFFPYVTRADVSDHNALALLDEADLRGNCIETMMITRTYMVRHGIGPMPTQDEKYRINMLPADGCNQTNPWQGHVRNGFLDIPLLRYAFNSLEGTNKTIAVTHLDVRVGDINGHHPPELCLDYADERFVPAWNPDRTLAEREAVGLYIGKCRPGKMESIPEGMSFTMEDYAHLIAHRIGERPARLMSYGSTAHEKRFLH